MNQVIQRWRDEHRRTALYEVFAWLLLTVFAYVLTFEFDDPLPVYDFGPAHWPRVVLICMFIATAWIFYSEFWKAEHKAGMSESVAQDREDSTENLLEGLDTRTKIRVAFIFILPVLYTYLMHKIGFILITPFFLFVYMMLMGVRRLRTLVIMTVSIYAALLIVFVKLIFTYLPPGVGIFHKINGTIVGWLS